MSDIQFTLDGDFMTQASPARKSTLDLQIDELENIFLNIEETNANAHDKPAPVPTISLPIQHNEASFYSSTPPSCSSNGSYSTGPLLSAPPSPSLVGFEAPRSLPGNVDWSEVLHSKMSMRSRPPESHSSFHGDDALPEPTSPSCGSTSGDAHSSYDAPSPGIHSVASDFGDLRLNTDILQHEPIRDPTDWMPSPGLLAPGPHHVGIRRWSSAGNQHPPRGQHHRFASQQLPSTSENFDFTNEGMGRGRTLTRAVSAPGSAAPSRRHSPYPPQAVDTVYESFQPGEASTSFHPVSGASSTTPEDKPEVMIVKETVTPIKIARAAALRRKNPAIFTCDFCPMTFTTKFKRDSHIDAHEGKKDFCCASCGKAFTRKSDCVRHERNTKKCTLSPISPISPNSPVSPVSPS